MITLPGTPSTGGGNAQCPKPIGLWDSNPDAAPGVDLLTSTDGSAATPAGKLTRLVQQRRLADARLTGNQKDAPATRGRSVEQVAQQRQFRIAPDQHW